MKAIERIYMYFNYKSIKPSVFEKKLGLGSGYFSTQKSRNADMGESILCKVFDNCPDLNPIWLILGEGEMIIDPQAEVGDSSSNLEFKHKLMAGELKGTILDLVSQIRNLAEENGALKAEIKMNGINLHK